MIGKIIDKWNELLYALMIAAFAIIFIVIYLNSNSSQNQSMYQGIELTSISKDWHIYGSSKADGATVLIPENFDVPAGKTVSIKKTCDNLTDGMALCFKTEHTSVRVIINNVEVYSFGWEDIPLGESPGSKWHVIPLYSADLGKIMEIQFCCAYDKYSGVIPEIFMGYEGDVNLYIQKNTMTGYLISAMILTLGVLLILVYMVARGFAKMRQLVYLGAYLIFIALWGMAESGYFQFLQGNDFGIYIMKCMLFAIVPVAMVMALKQAGLVKKNFIAVYGISFGCAVGVVVAQLLEAYDFFETTFWIHIAVLVVTLIIFMDNYVEYTEKKAKNFSVIFVAFVVLLSTVVLDLVDFYTFAYTETGFLMRIGSVAFVLLLGAWAVFQAMDVYTEGTKKEIFANMAYTDTLTGLFNRRAFDDDLKAIELDRTKVIVVMIDLNNLKTINDKLGHQSGDNAIKAISRRLKRFTEKSGERCYRTGGDEFCVICKKMNVNDIIRTCDEINAELYASREVPGAILSMAYGYKAYDPYMYDTVEQVVMKADEMMYEKKQKMKAEMAAKAQNS